MIAIAALIVIGFLVGTFGTLIGAGGGFILVPILLFMFPDEPPEVLTSVSLAVVFLNSTSGTIAYARKNRVDFRAGAVFAVASIPGAILGALAVSAVSRAIFEPIFGVLMIAGGFFVFIKPNRNHGVGAQPAQSPRTNYDLKIGVGISAAVGFVSSFLGIGGGIVHVPTLIHLLHFPVHVATATSHFVLAVMSLVGTGVHLIEGTLLPYIDRVIFLGVPAVFGAQLGAALSRRVRDVLITRGLALALILAGVRLLFVLLH